MVRKNLHKFLSKEFDELYPSSYGIIAHPFPAQGNDNLTCLHGGNIASASGRIFTELDSLRLNHTRHSRSDSSSSSSSSAEQIVLSSGSGEEERVVLAIGPEGGWEEEEVRQFEAKGFKRTQLGSRILRTDIAVCGFCYIRILGFTIIIIAYLICDVRLPQPWRWYTIGLTLDQSAVITNDRIVVELPLLFCLFAYYALCCMYICRRVALFAF